MSANKIAQEKLRHSQKGLGERKVFLIEIFMEEKRWIKRIKLINSIK